MDANNHCQSPSTQGCNVKSQMLPVLHFSTCPVPLLLPAPLHPPPPLLLPVPTKRSTFCFSPTLCSSQRKLGISTRHGLKLRFLFRFHFHPLRFHFLFLFRFLSFFPSLLSSMPTRMLASQLISSSNLEVSPRKHPWRRCQCPRPRGWWTWISRRRRDAGQDPLRFCQWTRPRLPRGRKEIRRRFRHLSPRSPERW